MSFTSIQEQLNLARLLITLPLEEKETGATLEEFGYSRERLEHLDALRLEVSSLYNMKEKEYAEANTASVVLKEQFSAARAEYVICIKLARIAFKNNPVAFTSLKLKGSRSRTYNGFIGEATSFYHLLRSNSTYGDILNNFGVNSKRLSNAVLALDLFSSAYHKYLIEEKEALLATKTRNRRFKELKNEVADLKAICKIAFANNNVTLKKLGLKSRRPVLQ